MNRRDFIFLVGAAAIWPEGAEAAQLPVIGYLYVGAPETSQHIQKAFKSGLAESGFFEGNNVVIEYRWAYNVYARLPELAADLVRLNVAVIATPSATSAARAVKSITSTVPIVFSGGADPVEVGLVSSLNRPGGNATGVAGMTSEVGVKRLQLIQELLQGTKRFGLLANPSSPSTINGSEIGKMKAAAAASGCDFVIGYASNTLEIEQAFSLFEQRQVGGVLIEPETLFINSRVLIASLQLRYKLPVVSPFREDAASGSLVSYGPSITDNARLAGMYTGRVLRGEKPADLPVLQPTKFEFVVNVQTGKMLGIEIPPAILARADEVIE